MITLEDLLTRPALEIKTDVSTLVEWFPELGFATVPNPNSLSNFKTQSRVTFHVLENETFRKGTRGERVVWKLGSVYFNSEVCMVLRNLRDTANDYYPKRFILDVDVFNAAVKYLFSLISPEKTLADNPVDDHFCKMFSGGTLFAPLQIQIPPAEFDLELLEQSLN